MSGAALIELNCFVDAEFRRVGEVKKETNVEYEIFYFD